MDDLRTGITISDLMLAKGRVLAGQEKFALEALQFQAEITREELLDLLEIKTEDTSNNQIITNRGYNPNRDSDGKFGSGASGSTSTGKGSYKPTAEYVSKFNGFQSKQTSDFSRAYQAEYSFKKAGIKGKPTKVDTLSEDSQVVYRGWDDQKHLSEFTDTEQSRLSWGLNGSGVYFSTQEKTASNYGNLVTTMGIKKDAKGVDYEVIRRKADIDHKRLNSQIESMRLDAQLTVDPKQRVKMRLESDELERTSDNMHLDLGVYAALNGYDYISDKDTSFYLILDKSKLEYTQ